LAAFLVSVTRGVRRCGMFSYTPSSRRFGSIMMNFTSSGLDLYRIEVRNVFRETLLPEPVDPATSRCGMRARSA